MTVRGFAEYLGVAPRTVAKWEARREGVQPLPETQSILDAALRRAPEEARDRFDALVARQAQAASYEPRAADPLPLASVPRSPSFELESQEELNVHRREFIAKATA